MFFKIVYSFLLRLPISSCSSLLIYPSWDQRRDRTGRGGCTICKSGAIAEAAAGRCSVSFRARGPGAPIACVRWFFLWNTGKTRARSPHRPLRNRSPAAKRWSTSNRPSATRNQPSPSQFSAFNNGYIDNHSNSLFVSFILFLFYFYFYFFAFFLFFFVFIRVLSLLNRFK